MSVDRNSVKSLKESACYFCNELFEMGQLQNHLKQCGSILEQCPLRCGAWIQRKHKDTHVKDCPRMEKDAVVLGTYGWSWLVLSLVRCIQRRYLVYMSGAYSFPFTSRNSTVPSHASVPAPAPPVKNHTWTPQDSSLDACLPYIEKELANVKLVLSEETNHREVQSTEIDTLRSKLILMDEQHQHFLSTLVSLRAAVDDEAERAANWAAQFKHDLSNVQLALQELQSQQMSTVMRLESTVSSLVHEQHERELLEQALTQHDNRIRTVGRLEEIISYLKQTIEEERERNAESRAALEAELSEVRQASEQMVQFAAVGAQQREVAAEGPSIDRLGILEVTTADARADTADLAARMDVVSRDLRALTKSYHKLRTELADFQARMTFGNELGSDNGHMIWRIDQFASRMKDAKENDTVMTSPHFRTSRYGYTLKAEVHLNGIGKWKGRHITCTVRMLGGPYDALLDWPCDIGVNIVLKDQTSNRRQALDIVKSLQLHRKSSSKRHDYDEGIDQDKFKSNEALDKSVLQLKRQYIFIPHTSLDKLDYIKDDVMFLEFIVRQ